MKEDSLVIGFDGSLTAFGWAMLTLAEAPRVVLAGCVCTAPDAKGKHLYQADQDGQRVDKIAVQLIAAIEVARSESRSGRIFVVIEAPAGAQHAASAKALGLAYGIARTVCVAAGLSPITVQAHEVKAVCGGSKGASKDEVASGVERLTGWRSSAKTKPAREGESDAVGVALTGMRHPLVWEWRRVA